MFSCLKKGSYMEPDWQVLREDSVPMDDGTDEVSQSTVSTARTVSWRRLWGRRRQGLIYQFAESRGDSVNLETEGWGERQRRALAPERRN